LNYGNGSGTPAYTYVSANAFSVTGDATAAYHAQRRVKAVGNTTGTIYGSILFSDYSAGETTVDVLWDSDGLESETLTIYLGLPADGTAPAATAAQILAGLERSLPLTPYVLSSLISAADPGYLKLPGLTIRFGTGTSLLGSPTTITYAEPFTSTVGYIGVTALSANNYFGKALTSLVGSFSARLIDAAGSGAPAGVTFFWVAIGD